MKCGSFMINTNAKIYGFYPYMLSEYYEQFSNTDYSMDLSLYHDTHNYECPYITIFHRPNGLHNPGPRETGIMIYLNGIIEFKNKDICRLYCNDHRNEEYSNIYDSLLQITKLVAEAYRSIQDRDAQKFLHLSKTIDFLLGHTIKLNSFFTVDMPSDNKCLKRSGINPNTEYDVVVNTENGDFKVGYKYVPNSKSRITLLHGEDTTPDFEIYDNGMVIFDETKIRFSLELGKDEIFETVVKLRRILADYTGKASDLKSYVKSIVPKKRKLLV